MVKVDLRPKTGRAGFAWRLGLVLRLLAISVMAFVVSVGQLFTNEDLFWRVIEDAIARRSADTGVSSRGPG